MHSRPLFLLEYIAISFISAVVCFIVVFTALMQRPRASHVHLNPAPVLHNRVITARTPATQPGSMKAAKAILRAAAKNH